MFSVPHLIIIFVVVLVVFGPEKLPELARNLGKIMGEFRRATGDLQRNFEDHLRDIERESSQRQAATGAGTTTAPVEQNMIGPPKTDSASAPQTAPTNTQKTDPAGAPSTLPRTTSRGWRAAPPKASAENIGKPSEPLAETPGATQADATHVQPGAVEPAQEHPGPEQASAAGASDSGHEKGSDGGTSSN
jgi:sec-independent protein translocase protein TatB